MTTLLPAVLSLVLFPVAPELWRETPLTSKTFKVPASPCVIADDALARQLELFRRLPSPNLRSQMALELGAVDHKDVFRGLVGQLCQEKDAFVRDDILKALAALDSRKQSVPVDGSVFESMFGASSPISRGHAMSLYLSCARNASADRVLSVLGAERSRFVLDRLKSVLVTRLEEVSVSRLRTLYEQSKENLALRCFALELMGRKGDGALVELLKAAVSSPNPVIRQHVMSGLGYRPDFGNALVLSGSKDADTGVRLSVANLSGIDSVREGILVNLLSDPSSSVRASAALSLGRNGCVSSAEVLSGHLADSDIVVRRAVADGLALLKPSRPIRNQVVSLADSEPLCRRQAVRFFVALSDRVASEPIHRWLQSSSDDLLTEESVRALGLLDYKASASAVASRGTSANENVRKAVADTLGILKVPSTYQMLKKLGRDGTYGVSDHAAMAMYRIGDGCFRDDYCRFLAGRSETGGDLRAVALRGLAALKVATSKTVKDAKTLATEACIIMPMAGAMPDTDYVRVSSLLYLYEMGKLRLAGADGVFESVMSSLLEMDESSQLMTPDLKIFVEQVEALRQGKPMPKHEVEPRAPIFTCVPLK